MCLKNPIECRHHIPFVRSLRNMQSPISYNTPFFAQDFTASAAWLAQQCRATHICHAFISSNRNLMHIPNDAAAFHTILRMMQDCQFSAYGVQTKNLASSKTATLRDKWRLRRYLTPDGKVCAVLF